MSRFPDIRFGICQVCGAKGGPQTDSLTSADAAARSTSGEDGYDPGNGVVLEKYKGKFMCPVCINDAKNNTESLRSAKKHAGEEKFRGKAGFVNTIS